MEGFSVIIPTRYTSAAVKFCYETLKKNSRLDHEYIIVCDMYTSWQTYKWLQENEIMYYEANLCSWYALMNYGATKATREYLAFFQDDLLVSEGWDVNIAKYLNHNVILVPTYLQAHEIGVDFGFLGAKNSKTQEDFRWDEFNQYCKDHTKEQLLPDVFGCFPEVIARDTFNKLLGYTTFTTTLDAHVHHEDGLKWRLGMAGGRDLRVGSSFSFHFANMFRDMVPLYGHHINKENDYIPLVCKKCGVKLMATELLRKDPPEAMNAATTKVLYDGFWICNQCK